jgi:hypothetical protein
MTLGGPSKYWVLPKEIMEPLKAEFKFNFDPCPFNGDGLVPVDGLGGDWGSSNWVNPLFGSGITAWVRKAIVEQQKGKDSVLILPLDNWVKLLLDARAEIRPIGSHNWVNPETGDQRKSSRPSFLFILRGKPA